MAAAIFICSGSGTCLETGDQLCGRRIGEVHRDCACVALSDERGCGIRDEHRLAAPRAFDLDIHRGDHCNYLVDSGRLIWHMVSRAVSAQTRRGL